MDQLTCRQAGVDVETEAHAAAATRALAAAGAGLFEVGEIVPGERSVELA